MLAPLGKYFSGEFRGKFGRSSYWLGAVQPDEVHFRLTLRTASHPVRTQDGSSGRMSEVLADPASKQLRCAGVRVAGFPPCPSTQLPALRVTGRRECLTHVPTQGALLGFDNAPSCASRQYEISRAASRAKPGTAPHPASHRASNLGRTLHSRAPSPFNASTRWWDGLQRHARRQYSC